MNPEAYEPDCSSVTDTHKSDSLFQELVGHLELKVKMPDDHAKQVRDVCVILLNCCIFLVFSILLVSCFEP